MIATIAAPSVSKLREAKYSLISRNVLPIQEFNYPTEDTPTFQGYVGLVSAEFWDLIAPRLDDLYVFIDINHSIRVYKSDAVSGAILWGRNANPNQIVVIK